MNKIYILFLGLIIAIVEMVIAWKLSIKSNKMGASLFFHGVVLIFESLVLTFINIKDNLGFVMFFAIFYVVSLIWLCNEKVNQKKSELYKEEQKRHSNWK